MAVGVLLGASLMMSQMCLTLFSVYLGLADNLKDDDISQNGPYRGLSAFYFLQMITYSAFTVLLLLHRGVVIDSEDASAAMSAGGAVPKRTMQDMTAPPGEEVSAPQFTGSS